MPAPYQQERRPFSWPLNDIHLTQNVQLPPSESHHQSHKLTKPFIFLIQEETITVQEFLSVSTSRFKGGYFPNPGVAFAAAETMSIRIRWTWIATHFEGHKPWNRQSCMLHHQTKNVNILCHLKLWKMQELQTSSTQDLAGSFANSNDLRISDFSPFSGDKR